MTTINNERVGSSDNKIVRSERKRHYHIWHKRVPNFRTWQKRVPRIFFHQASTELQTEMINYDSRFSSSNKSEKLRWPIEDVLLIESFNLAEIILLLQ